MKLTCDLCGGVLEMKNGSAVCQGCGLTYSMETLREKMGQPAPAASTGASTPARSVPAVPSQSLESQYNLIKMHIKNDDRVAAQEICNKLLAADYNNADAWELKVCAAFSGRGEVEVFFEEYLRTATTPEQKDRVIAFARKFFLNKSNKYDLMKSANILLPLCSDVANEIVNRSLEQNIKYVNERIDDFQKCNGPEEKGRYFRRYGTNLDYTGQERFVRSLIEFSRRDGSDIATNLHQLCSVEMQYANNVISSKCFESHTWMYKDCVRVRDFYKPILDEAKMHMKTQEERKKQEKIRKITEYWLAHPEEKQELEMSRADLQRQVNKLNAKFKNSDELQIQKELEAELNLLKSQRSSLGLFNFKEKKAVDEKINSKEIEIMRAKKKCEELEYQINNKVKDLQYKILKINDRLNLIGIKLEL